MAVPFHSIESHGEMHILSLNYDIDLLRSSIGIECSAQELEDYLLRLAYLGIPGLEQLSKHSISGIISRRQLFVNCDGILSMKILLKGEGVNIAGVGEKYARLRRETILFDAYISNIKSKIKVADLNALRVMVGEAGGVAFIGNGSLIPFCASRGECPSSDLPITTSNGIVPFLSPPTLEREFVLPFSSIRVRGMMIPKGLTVLTGGGFHGKSTLLRALMFGCYDTLLEVSSDLSNMHYQSPNLIVTVGKSALVRAEDGRQVSSVDISQFISDLPAAANLDPHCFSTDCASGSTSQAAAVIEAVEAGATLLLFDEDTSAANFMTRCSRMRSLIDSEPITPFIYRVNGLHLDMGVSSIVVVGANGDWFDVQDTTLMMKNYSCLDATKRAASISRTFCHGRVQYNGQGLVHRLNWVRSPSSSRRVPDFSHIYEYLSPHLLASSNMRLKERAAIYASEDGHQVYLLLQAAATSTDLVNVSFSASPILLADASKLPQVVREGCAGVLGLGVGILWLAAELSSNHVVHKRQLTLAEALDLYDTAVENSSVKNSTTSISFQIFRELTHFEIFLLPNRITLSQAVNRCRYVTFKIV